MTWRDISTAPRDGSKVLTWGCLHNDRGVDMGEQPSWQVSWWLDCGWYCLMWGSHEPTHWMPLPAPPVTTTEAERIAVMDGK